jgi:hypothetical protein
MTRDDVLLAMLATARGQSFTPVQIQKAMFLLTENLPLLVTGPSFNFVAYDYGPFDREVYDGAERLQIQRLAEIRPSPFGRWNTYAATAEGIEAGDALLARMSPGVSNYIGEISEWVRRQSFGGLVRSIYDAYPAMRANSIFRD